MSESANVGESRLGLLIASPPCQAWSMAGKREGLKIRRGCSTSARRGRPIRAPRVRAAGTTNAPRSWPSRCGGPRRCDPRISEPGWRGSPDDYDAEGNYIGKRSMDNAVRVSVEEASILQSFPPDYPWRGSPTAQFRQIGNAVPPLLARAILAALTEGHDIGSDALDLFAGPGGWDCGARDLGIDPLGIELDPTACATREAAGLRTLCGDVAQLDPASFADVAMEAA